MKIVIVGAGPSGLFCALKLLEKGHEVHLYERGSGVGKKLLVAGKSGLNITHSEDLNEFQKKYFGNEKLFSSLLVSFSNKDLIAWLESLGLETFVGTSGRVFPKDFKAAKLLKVILDKLESYSSFYLHLNSKLTSIAQDHLIINDHKIDFDRVIYSMGGASWSRLGTDGRWSSLFAEQKIQVNEFYSMNCGFEVNWSERLKIMAQNKPIKNIVLKVGDATARGDIMLTPYGIEGGAIYTISYELQKLLRKKDLCELYIDFLPDLSFEQVKKRILEKRKKDSLSNFLRKKFKFSKLEIALLQELSSKDAGVEELSKILKNGKIDIFRARPIDEAISTGGGISLDEINEHFELKRLPGHYAIGEMLDWVAPTGGYLLQGCFSQAFRVVTQISG